MYRTLGARVSRNKRCQSSIPHGLLGFIAKFVDNTLLRRAVALDPSRAVCLRLPVPRKRCLRTAGLVAALYISGYDWLLTGVKLQSKRFTTRDRG